METSAPAPLSTSPMKAKATSDVDRILGERIASLRKAAGISQSAVAKAIGVTFQQVQKYEKGANRVTFARLQLIAQVLNVPISEIHGDTTPSTTESPLTMMLATPGAIDLLRAYKALSTNESRAMVVKMTKELAVVEKSVETSSDGDV